MIRRLSVAVHNDNDPKRDSLPRMVSAILFRQSSQLGWNASNTSAVPQVDSLVRTVQVTRKAGPKLTYYEL